MRTLLPQLRSWIGRGERFALATVVRVQGSAPRAPGECLIISEDGLHFAGAVSSGCLENEVLEAAAGVLAGGRALSLHFGPEGQLPWSEGLSCGGVIEVRLEPWWGGLADSDGRAVAQLVLSSLQEDRGCLVLSRGDFHYAEACGGGAAGHRSQFSEELISTAKKALESGQQSRMRGEGREAVFIRLIHPRRRLLLVGAVDLAVRLIPLAQAAGYQTVVLDPRRAYAARERFDPPPDDLLCIWPGEGIPGLNLGQRDAAVVLSHDPKIDDPALVELLKCRVGYIGALGSVTSHQKRLLRLGDLGVPAAELLRIEGPAGIKLGVEAGAVAMGIMAGVVRGSQAPMAT